MATLLIPGRRAQATPGEDTTEIISSNRVEVFRLNSDGSKGEYLRTEKGNGKKWKQLKLNLNSVANRKD